MKAPVPDFSDYVRTRARRLGEPVRMSETGWRVPSGSHADKTYMVHTDAYKGTVTYADCSCRAGETRPPMAGISTCSHVWRTLKHLVEKEPEPWPES